MIRVRAGRAKQHRRHLPDRRPAIRYAAGFVAGLAVVPMLYGTGTASPSGAACAPKQAGGPMWVTADCVDPQYGKPVIDNEQDVTSPVAVHKVSGHFDGTDKKFTFYFPPKDKWQGRFFQYAYPLIDENITDADLEFDVASGGYGVQTNGGSGYRVDAAAAKFSKTVAAEYYGTSDRIYGYFWGGSGGSYETVGAVENSAGVWDGAVPFITGIPVSIPNYFFIRALGSIVLKDKAPAIADAVAPGGSDNPYAGLDDTQKAVLTEINTLGVPMRAWEDYQYVLGLGDNTTPAGPTGLLGFAAQVKQIDPTYADDFWSKPGYLGTEKSGLGDLIRSGKVDQMTTITNVTKDSQGTPTAFTVDDVPANPDSTGLDLTLYAADGTTSKGSVTGTLDAASKTATLGQGNSAEVPAAIAAGAKLRIDNRWYLALPAYARYQVPDSTSYYGFNQYRDAAGTPRYPQRPVQVDMMISHSVTGGGTYTGKINGKVIEVCNLLDTDAFTWDGDWYRKQVQQALGSKYGDSFRLWYNDNTDHIGARTDRLIDYTGILHQALRDVAAWAEKSRAPAQSTSYDVKNSQVSVPADAAHRHGIQPVVDLDVNGTNRVEVSAGQTVTFHGRIQVPPGTGKVVATAWNFTGTGDFTPKPFDGGPRETVEVTQTFTYNTPGTYFPELRATAQRDGNPDDAYTKIDNLGRMRVVVH
ncbi:hypothetical protein OIE68_09235 [Nocardia vinacea]|uniref:hypothetical protein n=1 Tax=Nocardia vinacea TaxID=96468 RepID=UPI002E0F1FC4|nr:hypothetical protein OIE68_09235 [Nocardia vinacea]